MVAFLVSDVVCAFANSAMVKERMWRLGKNSFDTWQEFEGWMMNAHSREIEQWVRNDGINWNAE